MKYSIKYFYIIVFSLVLLASCVLKTNIPQFKFYNMNEEQPIMEYGENGPIFYRRVDTEWHNDKPNTLVYDDKGLPIIVKPSDKDFLDQIIPFFYDSKISKVEGLKHPDIFVISVIFHDKKSISMCSSLCLDTNKDWVVLKRVMICNRPNKNTNIYKIRADMDCDVFSKNTKIEGIKSYDEGWIVYIDSDYSYQVWGIEDGQYKLVINRMLKTVDIKRLIPDSSKYHLPGIDDITQTF